MYRVKISEELEELIPKFLINRKNEILQLKEFVEEKNIMEIKRMGHLIKGVSGSYGFDFLSELAKKVEDYSEDIFLVKDCIKKMDEYLENIEIEYIED